MELHVFLSIIIVVFLSFIENTVKTSFVHAHASNNEDLDGDVDTKVLTTSLPSSPTNAPSQCGIYLALSTLPGTGIGMFAGRNFSMNERLLQAGDHLIPIVDKAANHPNDGSSSFFLWNEYTWGPEALYMEHLGASGVTIASPGFGAAANSYMDFVNADEQLAIHSIPQRLHRKVDPGAGAMTYHHSRYTLATRDIEAGEELFVSYGNEWFLGRKHKIGPIPIEGDHIKAENMYRAFHKRFIEQSYRKRSTTTKTGEMLPSHDQKLAMVAREMWEEFVTRTAFDDSPTMAAIPSQEELNTILFEESSSLTESKRSKMVRTQEWLETNGVCADNLNFGTSTLSQAGHGAFAARPLKRNEIILPIPLIHILNRSSLDMFDLTPGKSDRLKGDLNRPRPPQILLNYCLGHRDSSMLLSPYGPVFNLINHNQTMANVRLQWASPKRSQHKPNLLEHDLIEMSQVKTAQLAMELVTLRDIDPGEEIFLDYGNDWQDAWEDHIKNWKPVNDASSYQSAHEMNADFHHVFLTEFEQMDDPYSVNLMLKFHRFFENDKERSKWIQKNPAPIVEHRLMWQESKSVACDILERQYIHGRYLYKVSVPAADPEDGRMKILKEVPQEAIFFQDRPYTSDMHLHNAFRHDIHIPDDIFPEAWKNLR